MKFSWIPWLSNSTEGSKMLELLDVQANNDLKEKFKSD